MESRMADVGKGFGRQDVLNNLQRPGQSQAITTTSCPVYLPDLVSSLDKSVQNIISEIETVTWVANSKSSRGSLHLPEIISLQHGLEKLANLHANICNCMTELGDASAKPIMRQLAQLGRRNMTPPVAKLLDHFAGQIRTIVLRTIGKASEQDMLHTVAEACFKEVHTPEGLLSFDDHYAAFTADMFRGGARYEHYTRIRMDADYAAEHQKLMQQRSAQREQNRLAWSAFWTCIVSGSRIAPTASA